jgi:uncharacterized protein (UPF0335 family)
MAEQNTLDGGNLRAFVERIEHLGAETKALLDDIKDIYIEAKGKGYDAKIIRKVIAYRRMDKAKRREEEELLDLYLASLEEKG